MSQLIRRGLLGLAFGIALPLLRVGGQDAVPKTLDEYIDARGHIVNEPLHQATGWNVLRAFRWGIQVEERQGQFKSVDASESFRYGQRIRVRVEALADLHVYLLVLNSDGSEEVLVPQKFEQPVLVKRGATVSLPSEGALRFAPPVGKERIRLIASCEPLPWIAGRELFKLRSGEELTKQERETLEQLKSLQARSLKVAGRTSMGISLAETIGQIQAGTLPRGADSLLIEAATNGNLVGFATADVTSTTLMVHDIVLEHKD